MQPLIGIDLGTTNSLCAIFDQGVPTLIPNAHGQFLTPSIVGVSTSGEVLVGAAAAELRLLEPARCAATFKRWMGTAKQVNLGGKLFTAPELSSLVLQSLRRDAEARLGGKVTQAVITVPAYFNDQQRKATQLAGQLAGLDVRRIVNEPTAAALTYGFHQRSAEQKLLVIDLGGGTFDVTLMEIFEGTLEILATAGESHLGGEDFTDRLLAWVLRTQGLALETAELRSPLQVARLRQECELAKRQLGAVASCAVRLPNARGEFSSRQPSIEISFAAFRESATPLLERLRGPILHVLRDSRHSPEQLDEVILVGGATRMPLVREFVRELLGREPRTDWNPDEVVAQGAAVQAALIADDAAVNDLVMTDVCPFTLGVETAKEMGGDYREGYFLPIIHRNTTIPVSRVQTVQTLYPHQEMVLLKVYQGESRLVKDNLLLGELQVSGIPRGPAGQEVCIRFTYDLNGILEVEALVPATERKFVTVLAGQAGHLSPAEIAVAVAKMQALKFYPRDDERHRRLLLFATRMVAEVPPQDRATLDLVVDQFERAMRGGDRERFDQARLALVEILRDLGLAWDGDDDVIEDPSS